MSRDVEERLAWGGEIGPILRDAREGLGLSLKEAERTTRIRASYLEGLEKENPAELPGKSYVQAFLRSYAEFLDLEADEMSRRYRERSGWRRQQPKSRETASASPAERASQRPGRRKTLLILSLAILAMICLVTTSYVVSNPPRMVSSLFSSGSTPADNGSGEEEPEEASPREPEPATSSDGGEESGTKQDSRADDSENQERAEESRGLTATVRVSGAESWISLESEDGIEYTGIAQPGFSQSFDVGDSFTITTGNAGAVDLDINGQEYGRLGESGEVTAKSFSLKGGG